MLGLYTITSVGRRKAQTKSVSVVSISFSRKVPKNLQGRKSFPEEDVDFCNKEHGRRLRHLCPMHLQDEQNPGRSIWTCPVILVWCELNDLSNGLVCLPQLIQDHSRLAVGIELN